MASAALLVIDVQRALFEPTPRPWEADEVLSRINALAARARAADAPVVFVQHERADTSLAHGSDGWQLATALELTDTDLIVRKTTPDSFHGTDLQARLDALSVRELVIVGYACEFCVDTTTRRAASLGYAVTLAADAHTTHEKAHASAERIRAHANATLPELTSFAAPIRAIASNAVRFMADGAAASTSSASFAAQEV